MKKILYCGLVLSSLLTTPLVKADKIQENNTKIQSMEILKNQLHTTAEMLRNSTYANDTIVNHLGWQWSKINNEEYLMIVENDKMQKDKAEENSKGKYIGDFRISYYTCSPSENGGSTKTAKGQKLTDVVGVCIAADPKVIPYNSKVYIEGVGYRTVLDCGGAIKGNKIDVLVRNSSQIPKQGVHTSKVYLLD